MWKVQQRKNDFDGIMKEGGGGGGEEEEEEDQK